MPDYLSHVPVGADLYQDEYENASAHQIAGQTLGDLSYFDGTGWTRKAKGFLNKVVYTIAPSNSAEDFRLSADKTLPGEDDSVELAAAFAAYNNIHIAPGDLQAPIALLPRSFTKISGSGISITYIGGQTASQKIIDFSGTSTRIRKQNLIIEDLTIAAPTRPGVIGIYAIFNFGPNCLENIRVGSCSNYGIYLDNNAAHWVLSRIRIESCGITGVGGAGLRIGISTDPILIYASVISSNHGIGVLIDGIVWTMGVIGGVFDSNELQAFDFEAAAVAKLQYGGVEGNSLLVSNLSDDCCDIINNGANLTIEDWHFNGDRNSGASQYERHAIHCKEGVTRIKRCRFTNYLSFPIYVEAGASIEIDGNTLGAGITTAVAGGDLSTSTAAVYASL